MKLLFVVATLPEIQPLLDRVGMRFNEQSGNYEGSYGTHQLSCRITGVGMVSTAFQTTLALQQPYELVINAGICGSFNSNLPLGAVVQVYEDNFSELGAEDGKGGFLSLSELSLPGISKITNLYSLSENQVLHELPRVNGITVNTTHGENASIDAVFKRLHPFVESMEGAAFMLVADQLRFHYLQVRAVSNYVEQRQRDNWNIPLAIANLNDTLFRFISSLS